MARRKRKGAARSPDREKFWRGHLADQPHSGLSIRAYCARHNLSEPSFYAWRRELVRRDAERAEAQPPIAEEHEVEGPHARSGGSSKDVPRFAELVLTGVPADSSETAPAARIHLETETENVRIDVFPGCGRDTLAHILHVLRSRSC